MRLLILFIISSSIFASTNCVIDGKNTNIAELSEKKFTNLDETIVRMNGIVDCLEQNEGDRRIVFTSIYTELTQGLADLRTVKKFSDLLWYEILLNGAAERFRLAFHAYETNDKENLPACWERMYSLMASDKKIAVPLQLFLGMICHITYDLAMTVHDIPTNFYAGAHFDDYNSLNPYFTEITPHLWDVLDSFEKREKPRSDGNKHFRAGIVNKWILKARIRAWVESEELFAAETREEYVTARSWIDQRALKRINKYMLIKGIMK